MFEHLHLHSLDRYDSQNLPEEVCKRLKELGFRYCAVTQHGVVSAVEPMRDAAAKYGLVFIPGIETYYDEAEGNRAHGILLAKSYKGWIQICKAVSESQNTEGYSVMTEDILRKRFGEGAPGHGEVFFLSACIQGVFAVKLRKNEVIEREIEKITARRARFVPDGTEQMYAEKKAELEKAEAELSEVDEALRFAKDWAGRKYTAREKAVQKLAGTEGYEEAYAALENDKKMSAQAVHAMDNFKSIKTEVSKQVTLLRQECKKLSESIQKAESYDREIADLKSKKVNENEIVCETETEMRKFQEIFGSGNMFVEIQNHGIEEEREIYPKLVRIARKHGYPLAATNDCHIVLPTEQEFLRRNTLKALRFGEWQPVEDSDKELYIKSEEEMSKALSELYDPDVVKEAMENTVRIAESCSVEWPNESHYPKFPGRDGNTSEEIFDEEIEKGVRWRFPDGMTEEYQSRLKREVSVIKSMGYCDYHLIVKDFLEYGRALSCVPAEFIDEAPLTIKELQDYTEAHGWQGGFTIGPGRGSAVGSLACYVLGITSLDPLKYDLLFERFLNPERVSMPDIDSDIAKRVRPKVIEYIRHKYGENAVCGILTTNAQAPKGCIRMAAKYYAISKGEEANTYISLADQIAKAVPATVGIHFNDAWDTGTDDNSHKTGDLSEEETVLSHLLCEYDTPEAHEILSWAASLEGSFTSYGAHAAGIIISDNDDITDYIPLRWNEKLKEFTSQCDMVKVEELGLLKMDCLGLRTLDIITDCLRMIEENHGILIDPLKLDIADENVFREIFQKARTNSVFQFESDGMKSMLKRFKPTCFEDLIILVSMFRPGPLQFLDDVIDVKNGKPYELVTPELEPILGKTYGAICYQEQVMEIFQKLAGYTLGGADMVRRYMSKKKLDKLAHEKDSFVYGDPERKIPGCIHNGIGASAAEKLFDQMTQFAKYAFNKSHAAAYAYNSYITGYLKHYYSAEFIAAALNWAAPEKVPGLMREAVALGVSVLGPDINHSGDSFRVEDGKILFGMSSVKSVGQAASEILLERDTNGRFRSLLDFYMRTNVSKSALENLIKAGAFDSFNPSRLAMVKAADEYKKAVKKFRDAEHELKEADPEDAKLTARLEEKLKRTENDMRSIVLSHVKDDPSERLKEEYEFLGDFISDHPMNYYDVPEAYLADPVSEMTEGSKRLIGVITSVDVKKRKRDGKEMAFVTVEDKSGEITANFFTKAYAEYRDLLHVGTVLLMSGTVSGEEDESETDESGNPVIRYSFSVNTCKIPERKKSVYEMTISSYPKFHLYEEELFMKRYIVPDLSRECGHKIYVFETITGERRELNYQVSERALELKNVKEHY